MKMIYYLLEMILGSKSCLSIGHRYLCSLCIVNFLIIRFPYCFQGVCELRSEHKDTVCSRGAANEFGWRSWSLTSAQTSLQWNWQRECVERALWWQHSCLFQSISYTLQISPRKSIKSAETRNWSGRVFQYQAFCGFSNAPLTTKLNQDSLHWWGSLTLCRYVASNS